MPRSLTPRSFALSGATATDDAARRRQDDRCLGGRADTMRDTVALQIEEGDVCAEC
jgi:hypothetical protein